MKDEEVSILWPERNLLKQGFLGPGGVGSPCNGNFSIVAETRCSNEIYDI